MVVEVKELSLAILQDTKTPEEKSLELYFENNSDLDKQAQLLNEEVITLEPEGGVVTPQTLQTLKLILSSDQDQLNRYHHNAISGLSNENLIAIANSIAEQKRNRYLKDEAAATESVIGQIYQAAEEDTLVKQNGATFENPSFQPPEETEHLEFRVFQELGDRLSEGGIESTEVMQALEQLLTRDLIKFMKENHPETLVIMAIYSEDFVSDKLRARFRRYLNLE